MTWINWEWTKITEYVFIMQKTNEWTGDIPSHNPNLAKMWHRRQFHFNYKSKWHHNYPALVLVCFLKFCEFMSPIFFCAAGLNPMIHFKNPECLPVSNLNIYSWHCTSALHCQKWHEKLCSDIFWAMAASYRSSVQCRLTGSTGLHVDRHHTPRYCGYDVRCCRSKKQGIYIC